MELYLAQCVLALGVVSSWGYLYILQHMNYFGLCYEASWFFDGIFSSGIVWAINAIIESYEDK
jgi:hypothetical protein